MMKGRTKKHAYIRFIYIMLKIVHNYTLVSKDIIR